MTIERFEEGFGYVATCDYCGEEVHIDKHIWSEVIHEMKEYGWKIKKNNNEWEHICPDCLMKEIKENPNG